MTLRTGRSRGILTYWPWLVLTILISTAFTAYKYLEHVIGGGGEPFFHVFVKEMSGGLGVLLLVWPLIRFMRRFPLISTHWVTYMPVHALGIAAYSVLHTSWNWAARSAIYPLVGFGSYSYGEMPTRYFMEFPLDIIVYSVILVIVTLIDRAQAAQEKELQMVRLKEQLHGSKLAQLQSQLRPHFLFNSLNTVSAVMYQDVARADGVLQALADILRRMVDQSDATVIPLNDEIQLVGAAAEIMGARFEDDLSIETDVEDGVEDWPVPPLLLQPLVENAIQHGFEDGQKPPKISLSARRNNGRLRIEIADDGPGLRESVVHSDRAGVGLSNTRERLATQYGADHSFELTNPPEGGLRITIEIPWTESAR